MEPYRGPNGGPTSRSPAYVGKASRFRMAQPELGIDLDLVGHNAIQGHFDVHG